MDIDTSHLDTVLPSVNKSRRWKSRNTPDTPAHSAASLPSNVKLWESGSAEHAGRQSLEAHGPCRMWTPIGLKLSFTGLMDNFSEHLLLPLHDQRFDVCERWWKSRRNDIDASGMKDSAFCFSGHYSRVIRGCISAKIDRSNQRHLPTGPPYRVGPRDTVHALSGLGLHFVYSTYLRPGPHSY